MCSAAGQEDDLASAKPALYSSANAFVLCYSIISPSSYESVRSKVRAIALVRGERERESAHLPYDVAQWLSEIRHYNTHAPILLVGTKPDLRDNPHIVSRLQERDLQPLTYKQGHQLAKGLLRLRISSASANQRTHTRKHADTLAMYRVCACVEIGALHFAEVTSVAPTDGMTDEELSALFQATIKELVRGAKKKTMSARCVLL